jgi:cell division protein FtsW
MRKGAFIFLYLAVGALITLGLVILTSASSRFDDASMDQYFFLTRQAMWLGVGIAALVVMAFVDYRKLRRFSWPLFFVICLALALCFVPGIGDEAKGENRWIVIPGVGLRFQPSEPAKLIIMVVLASWFARYQAEIRSFSRGFLVPCIILGIPLLLILLETDMGTTAGLGAAGLIVMYVAGSRLQFMLPSVAVAVAMLVVMVQQDPNRMRRITAFTNLEEHKEGAGWQQLLALEAFGNGGSEGLGLGNGLVKQKNFPEHHTDFIFPVIGEELGVFVSMGVILCFVVFLLTGMFIALSAPDLFGRLLGIGLTCSIVIPAMMNIGVTTACLPNTGLPLPFVSYGGTNLVFTMAMVGVLLSILRRSRATELSEIPVVKDKVFEVRL